jgi:hypothetical protein
MRRKATYIRQPPSPVLDMQALDTCLSEVLELYFPEYST